MSTSPSASATAVKKTAAKEGSVPETTRRIRPTRIKGWMELAANAYGLAACTRNLGLVGRPEYAIKSKKDNDSGGMVLFTKQTQVLVPGIVIEANDERVLIRMDDESVGLFRTLEDDCLEQADKLVNTEGKSAAQIQHGENLLRIKTKYFKGRYTHKYVKGEKEEGNKYEDMTGKRVEVIVRFYGHYTTEDMCGVLASVGAYNILE